MITARRRSGSQLYQVICTAQEHVGDLVKVVGAGKQVSRVNVASRALMPATGVITAKLSDSIAVMQLTGPVEGVYTGLTPGRLYFVGMDGRPSLVPPATQQSPKRIVQIVGSALDQNILLLAPNTSLIEW